MLIDVGERGNCFALRPQALQRLQEEAWDVEKHLSNAQLALNYLEEHSGPGGQMGTEEYEIIRECTKHAGYTWVHVDTAFGADSSDGMHTYVCQLRRPHVAV